MTKQEMKATVCRVRDRIRITKVVCTRSVKGRGGDSFVGFSASFDSVQQDGMQGLGDDDDTQRGMSLKDAKVAAYMLGLQADLTAFENASAGSVLTQHECENAKHGIKHNYTKLMEQLLGDKGN